MRLSRRVHVHLLILLEVFDNLQEALDDALAEENILDYDCAV